MELTHLSDSILKDLANIEKLIYQAKFDKAHEAILKLQKTTINDSSAQVRINNLKARICCFKGQYRQAIEIGEKAYQLSQKLGDLLESINALIIKSHIIYFNEIDDAYDLIIEAENLLNSIREIDKQWYSKRIADILLMKAIIYRSKGELNEAFKLAKECLLIRENLNSKLDLTTVYYILGELNLYKGDSFSGLDCAMKSLKIQEELGNQFGKASDLSLAGTSYFVRGDFEQAFKYARLSLKISEISTHAKIESLETLASIYINRGQLDRAIKYRNKINIIAKKENYRAEYISSTYGMGVIYRIKGEFDIAKDFLTKSLDLSIEFNSSYGIQISLFFLILISLDNNVVDQARNYLKKLEKFSQQTENTVFKDMFLISKALVLKNSGRIRNFTEAEEILRKITEKEIQTPIIYRLALVNLCELYLEELKFTDNIEVLEEIKPLINKLYRTAENQNAYPWLTDTKLLQAKIALIQMDFDKAMQLLTQAQRIAELHGDALLALKISSEHDNFLNQLKEWDKLKKDNAPMSKRMELASINGVVNQMQGKSIAIPPLITPETPVLLLIIGQGGFPLFSKQFEENHLFEEDLISGFLAAFNSFSGELFSKGLDRIKFDEYMILMQTVESFSVCYLFKGQTYIAKQKLTKFTESIKNDDSIWRILNIFYNTSRVVKLENLPSLESLIKNIFLK